MIQERKSFRILGARRVSFLNLSCICLNTLCTRLLDVSLNKMIDLTRKPTRLSLSWRRKYLKLTRMQQKAFSIKVLKSFSKRCQNTFKILLIRKQSTTTPSLKWESPIKGSPLISKLWKHPDIVDPKDIEIPNGVNSAPYPMSLRCLGSKKSRLWSRPIIMLMASMYSMSCPMVIKWIGRQCKKRTHQIRVSGSPSSSKKANTSPRLRSGLADGWIRFKSKRTEEELRSSVVKVAPSMNHRCQCSRVRLRE